MVDPELYISQGLKIIKTLVEQGNFQSALQGCQELLKVNPYHRKVQKYLKNIEEELCAQNIKKVDKDLDATMHLWQEGRYDDLLKIYTKLYQYTPQYKRLRGLIEKLNTTMSQQQSNQRTDFIKQAVAAISGLMNESRYAEAIQASTELLSVDPVNEDAEKVLKKAKTAIIDQKLTENERIIDGADFERASDFYRSLIAIDPSHARAKSLLQQVQAHMAEQKMIAEKIHLNESVMRMKELFKSGEYEKVLQACEEIRRLDPGNFTAKVFYRRATKTMNEEIEILALKKVRELNTVLQTEYGKSPSSFVKI